MPARLLLVLLLVGFASAGCDSSSAVTPATETTAATTVDGTDADELPASDEILAQIDDALDFTYQHRRLSVGPSKSDQAAWQIIHGALAFKREFLVHDGTQDVSAVDYVLAGRPMKGMEFLKGDVLDPKTNRVGIRSYVAGDKMGQGHTDQWMGYLSDCQLPLDEPIVVGGDQHTVADYIDQMQLDVHKNPIREYTWTLMALTAYYPTDHAWTAGDGETWSIEKLVEIEMEHSLEDSPCGGTHRMTALTIAYNRHIAAGGQDEGLWKQLKQRIDQCVTDARQFQNADGSLSSNYFLRPGKSPDLAIAMGSAGHTMEFLATALDKDQLQEPWVQRAVLDVCKLFRKTKPVDVECGALFHAAHGLVLYREKVFGPRTFGGQ
ncbi:MAG: ADP-ribosylation factor-directed GTPase activating protein isoform b [Pirellulaceae bacterium]